MLQQLPCATCSSPAPTPSCTEARTLTRLRRLPPDQPPATSSPTRLTRRQALGRRPRRGPHALPRAGDAARPRVRGRRGAGRRRRPTRRCSCRCSCPAASTCSTRSCRSTSSAPTPTCARAQARGRPAARLDRPRRPPLADARRAAAGSRACSTAGKIGFLPGIDYANPDLSHFHSRNFWETGLLTRKLGRGLARPLARRNGGRRQPAPGRVDGLLRSRRVLRSDGAPVAAVTSPGRRRSFAIPRRLTQRLRARRWRPTTRMAAPRARGAGPAAADAAARFAKERRPTASAATSRSAGATRSRRSPATPKGALGSRLKVLAGLLSKPLGHPRGHRRGRRATSTPTTTRRPSSRPASPRCREALSAFQVDLEVRGLSTARHDLRVDGVRPPARRRTTRSAPTTAPAASRGCRAPGCAAGSSATTRT